MRTSLMDFTGQCAARVSGPPRQNSIQKSYYVHTITAVSADDRSRAFPPRKKSGCSPIGQHSLLRRGTASVNSSGVCELSILLVLELIPVLCNY